MKYIQAIRNLFNRQAIVLMYHRITDTDTDPWQLAVSPRNFEEQLQVLQKKYRVIAVSELVQQLYCKDIKEKCVCLTFDDGYSDNYVAAKPLLEKYATPTSFFIPSEYIDKNNPFWWDELEDLILKSSTLPAILSLSIGGENLLFHLNSEALTDFQVQQQQSWVWPAPPPTDRCSLYLHLWERLKPLAYPEIQLVLKNLKEWAGYIAPANKNNIPMTGVQLKTLAAHPLFTIGLHTVTHPALAFHSYEVQSKEIAGNREWMVAFINKRAEALAYPYGNFNDTTVAVLKEQGILAGFTTESKLISKNDSPYRLGRFQVNNWDGETFERQLYNWTKGA